MQLQSLSVEKTVKTVTVLIRLFFAPFLVFIVYLLFEPIAKIQYVWLPTGTPLHFIGGVAIAHSLWMFLPILQTWGIFKSISPRTKILFAVIGTTLAAVSWEFVQRYFSSGPFFQIDYSDTLKDLTVGIFGGFVCSMCLVFFRSRAD